MKKLNKSKILIILGIIILVFAFIIYFGSVYFGIAFGALGIFVLVKGIKAKKAIPQTAAVSKEAELEEDNDPSQMESGDTSENIRVAGTFYHQDAILALGTKNPVYKFNLKQILDAGLDGQPIYQYTFPDLPAELVFEPDNEEDPNAIAIYVKKKKIGYVKRGSTAHIRKIINSGRLMDAVCTITSGPYKICFKDSDKVSEHDERFYAKVHLVLKDN